jgi:hypothetical protein
MKHAFEIASTDDGRQIDRRDEQAQNTTSPTCESREPHSNLKSERLSQNAKQYSESVSTDEGIQID